MGNPVKTFWFQIHWQRRGCSPHVETVIYTGKSLPDVLTRIEAAQRGRLVYDPDGPRIVRIAALAPLPCDAHFSKGLAEILRMENNNGGPQNANRAPSP